MRKEIVTGNKNTVGLKDIYGIDYDPSIEPTFEWMKNNQEGWVQEADNHRAIFDEFYRDVERDKSLCVIYAKQVPFVEDSRRVVLGMGHITNIIPAVEHRHNGQGKLRSMTWETMLCHSIRDDHKDGFIIPYQRMLEYAEEHEDFDFSSIVVFNPDDAFEEFSFATEHITHDAMIDVIQSCIKSFRIINECLGGYADVLAWLNARLAEVWEDRGAFPGLGEMLCALGVPLGVVIAKDPDVVTELAWWANNIGVTGGAFDSYLLLRGLRTLVPRMELAQRNAQAIVKYLQTQPLVKKLYHPSLPENQGHEIAARQQKGFGAMLSFELDGDEQTLRRFLGGLSLFTLAESLGGVESLISHAATMTHAGMAPEARAAAGISETLLRISTGIEDGEDLIADLENGFRAANKG